MRFGMCICSSWGEVLWFSLVLISLFDDTLFSVINNDALIELFHMFVYVLSFWFFWQTCFTRTHNFIYFLNFIFDSLLNYIQVQLWLHIILYMRGKQKNVQTQMKTWRKFKAEYLIYFLFKVAFKGESIIEKGKNKNNNKYLGHNKYFMFSTINCVWKH